MAVTDKGMLDVIHRLPFWTGKVSIEPITGGMTNSNFCVTDADGKYFVRLGKDIPVHGVLRFNEFSASQAAAECKIAAPGATFV